jgi:hypothetical protein
MQNTPTEIEIKKLQDKYSNLNSKWGVVLSYMREYDDNPLMKDGPWDSMGNNSKYFDNVRNSRDYVMNFYTELVKLFKGNIDIKNPLLIKLPKVVRKSLISHELLKHS